MRGGGRNRTAARALQAHSSELLTWDSLLFRDTPITRKIMCSAVTAPFAGATTGHLMSGNWGAHFQPKNGTLRDFRGGNQSGKRARSVIRGIGPSQLERDNVGAAPAGRRPRSESGIDEEVIYGLSRVSGCSCDACWDGLGQHWADPSTMMTPQRRASGGGMKRRGTTLGAAVVALGFAMAASLGLAGAGTASASAPALKIKPFATWTVEFKHASSGVNRSHSTRSSTRSSRTMTAMPELGAAGVDDQHGLDGWSRHRRDLHGPLRFHHDAGRIPGRRHCRWRQREDHAGQRSLTSYRGFPC